MDWGRNEWLGRAEDVACADWLLSAPLKADCACNNTGVVFRDCVGVGERESNPLSVVIGLLKAIVLSVDIAGEKAEEGEKVVVEAPS
jgi:hypothetical protein